MSRSLSPWSKEVKKAMIDRDMSVSDLAEALNISREYVSAVVNGRVISDAAIKAISDYFNIPDTAKSSTASIV